MVVLPFVQDVINRQLWFQSSNMTLKEHDIIFAHVINTDTQTHNCYLALLCQKQKKSVRSVLGWQKLKQKWQSLGISKVLLIRHYMLVYTIGQIMSFHLQYTNQSMKCTLNAWRIIVKLFYYMPTSAFIAVFPSQTLPG